MTLAISATVFASDYDVNPGTYSGNISKDGQSTKEGCIAVVQVNHFNTCPSECSNHVDVRITQHGYVLATAISIDPMGIAPYSPFDIPALSSEDQTVNVTGKVSSDLDTRGNLETVTINFQDKWDSGSVFYTCEHLKLLGSRK